MCPSAQNESGLIRILYRSTAFRTVISSYGEDIMNEDQVKGRIEEAKGEAKKIAGKAVGNKAMERKGKLQNAHGKAQAKLGDLRGDIKKSI